MLCSQFRDSLAHDSVGKPYRPPTICPLISAKELNINFGDKGEGCLKDDTQVWILGGAVNRNMKHEIGEWSVVHFLSQLFRDPAIGVRNGKEP